MAFRRRNHGDETSATHPVRLPPSPTTGDKKGALLQKLKSRRFRWQVLLALPVFVLCFFGITHLINVAMAYVHPIWDGPEYKFLDAWATNPTAKHDSSELANLTQNVHPIACHSHNDYWRRVPLYEALRYGCTGVEADVWLFDNDLFVGHSTNALTKDRTFRAMYVDPLVQILDIQNAQNEFTATTSSASSTPKNGVFTSDPTRTLVLLVDFKNSGRDIYPVVSAQLTALRSKGYLSYHDGTTLHTGPVTVVATGNAPFDLITGSDSTHRDIFFDAPLERLYEDPGSKSDYRKTLPTLTTPSSATSSEFNLSNSYYASVSFASSIGYIWFGHLTDDQVKKIRGQVQGARRRGLKARYWATPEWPIALRNKVWRILEEEGVDYLNGDDLRGMARVDWGRKRHYGAMGS
ncbi:hypothetical protein B0J11DRAFT_445898 [Dendryphion nanum]|uniref:Altered inheritance of mitochondria protein 6 n=1 Tax=Dendryphion nanum TaxID=256645 RepID=A0A9P9D7F4_9PLEO|nr:hypothetical protein B0J11DRAFT_445898 [Dendryphion nanum]